MFERNGQRLGSLIAEKPAKKKAEAPKDEAPKAPAKKTEAPKDEKSPKK